MSDEVANELKLRLFVPLKAIQFVLAASVIGCILLAVYSFIKWIIFNNKVWRWLLALANNNLIDRLLHLVHRSSHSTKIPNQQNISKPTIISITASWST